jgi:hypothetical protein
VTVVCHGLTEAEGSAAELEVAEEFRHRGWHQDVRCDWKNPVLRLVATNDFDHSGQALLDEFWDAVLASVSPAGTISFSIESAE